MVVFQVTFQPIELCGAVARLTKRKNGMERKKAEEVGAWVDDLRVALQRYSRTICRSGCSYFLLKQSDTTLLFAKKCCSREKGLTERIMLLIFFLLNFIKIINTKEIYVEYPETTRKVRARKPKIDRVGNSF
ncbi:MAG: hypothetical protein R2792_02485 [Saprospiraceae bacterium]